jgi:hypothetical protein
VLQCTYKFIYCVSICLVHVLHVFQQALVLSLRIDNCYTNNITIISFSHQNLFTETSACYFPSLPYYPGICWSLTLRRQYPRPAGKKMYIQFLKCTLCDGETYGFHLNVHVGTEFIMFIHLYMYIINFFIFSKAYE